MNLKNVCVVFIYFYFILYFVFLCLVFIFFIAFTYRDKSRNSKRETLPGNAAHSNSGVIFVLTTCHHNAIYGVIEYLMVHVLYNNPCSSFQIVSVLIWGCPVSIGIYIGNEELLLSHQV